MTSLLDICSETNSIEHLSAIALTDTKAQEVVHRLRSTPGLMITLTVPTETASVRAIDLVGHTVVQFGVPFETDGVMLVRLGNGACFYVVVDRHLQSSGPFAGPYQDSDGQAANASHGVTR
jgi:hypothetical protein